MRTIAILTKKGLDHPMVACMRTPIIALVENNTRHRTVGTGIFSVKENGLSHSS